MCLCPCLCAVCVLFYYESHYVLTVGHNMSRHVSCISVTWTIDPYIDCTYKVIVALCCAVKGLRLLTETYLQILYFKCLKFFSGGIYIQFGRTLISKYSKNKQQLATAQMIYAFFDKGIYSPSINPMN